jgi:hypothetical protein
MIDLQRFMLKSGHERRLGICKKLQREREKEREAFDALQRFLNHVVLAFHTFELHFYLNVVTECLTLG